MWDELEPAWRATMEEVWEAYCAGSHPIGAVVTDAGGHVVARGRNHIFDDDGEATVHGNPLAHAEVNALVDLDYRAIDPHGCALYSSTEPCPLCFGAFYMSGVRVLHYGARDGWCGSAELLGTTPYLRRKPVRVFGPTPQIERVVMVLSTEFHLRKDRRRAGELLAAQRMLTPEPVRLGERFQRTGELWAMATEGRAAAEVVAIIGRRLDLGR